MRTTEKTTEKRMYTSPVIVCVELDNEISLVLESSPPEGPGEGLGYNKNNPFKSDTSLV